jgi:predicted amidophosphoribosyltransferase
VHLAIPGIEGGWAAGPYGGVGRDLVSALKFDARLRLARRAALAVAVAPEGVMDGTLVPVPAAPWRRRRRGFDAAEEIAAALASATGLSLTACLRRPDGPRQVGRRRPQRIANPPRIRVAGNVPERAVLVDDVVTTGATLRACAQALRESGASRVVAVAFAAA